MKDFQEITKRNLEQSKFLNIANGTITLASMFIPNGNSKGIKGGITSQFGGIKNPFHKSALKTAKILATSADDALQSTIKATKTGTVWDNITPTSPYTNNTIVPKSFELSLENGNKVYVTANATEHITQNPVTFTLKNGAEKASLNSQLMLEDLSNSINSATKNGIEYDTLIKNNEWELKFAPPRTPDELPAVTHALKK